VPTEPADRSRHFTGLAGDLDLLGAPAAQRTLLAALNTGPAVLEVDLTEVAFLGAAGYRMLLEVNDSARRSGTEVVLTGAPPPAVYRALQIFGLPLTEP
jgi:anti-anti-sigma factor